MAPQGYVQKIELIADSNERLDQFLARSLPEHSRSRLTELVDAGGVLVDGRAQKRSFRLRAGAIVTLDVPPPRAAHDLTPFEFPLDVVFEDEHLLVVNKPRGMATHPAPTLREPSLVNVLLARSSSLSSIGESFRPGIVHRLDKDTTGLILIAKTDAAHVKLARMIQAREVRREYLAIVALTDRFGEWTRIDAPIARDPRNRLRMAVNPSGKGAITLVRRISSVGAYSVLQCKLETGRTHQIRVHLAAVGCPVVGDPIYGKPGVLQLHAWKLEFEHPITAAGIALEAEPPKDFAWDRRL